MDRRPELSSLAATLEELARRVTELTDAATAAGDDEAMVELVGLERQLQGSLRRMRRLL